MDQELNRIASGLHMQWM